MSVAPAEAEAATALHSAPEIQVFLYRIPALSAQTLRGAEVEAARILRPARINLDWVDCTPFPAPAGCSEPISRGELVVRVLTKAPAQVNSQALGSAGAFGAYVFYDRITALRTHDRVINTTLGRVMAHEITHLLLPGEGHARLGLMRATWSTQDLQFGSAACLGLSARSIRLMQQEALRRSRAEIARR